MSCSKLREATFVVVGFALLENMFYVLPTANLETSFYFCPLRTNSRQKFVRRWIESNQSRSSFGLGSLRPPLYAFLGGQSEEQSLQSNLLLKFDSTRTSLSMRSLLFGLPAVVYKRASVIWPGLAESWFVENIHTIDYNNEINWALQPEQAE